MQARRTDPWNVLGILLAAATALQAQDPGSARPGGKTDAAAAAAPAAAQKAGGALFAKVVHGLGGAQKVSSVKDVRIKARATLVTPQGEIALGITQTTVFPDKTQQEIEAPFGLVTTVFTPQAAFMASPAGSQDLPASAREEQAKDLSRSPLILAQRANDPRLSVSAAGKEKIGEVETALLDVSYKGVETRWFVDPATGRILRSSYTSAGQQGPVAQTTDYSDFRAVDGLTFAFKQESRVNGEKTQAMTLEEVKINSNPDPKIFEKPAPGPQPK